MELKSLLNKIAEKGRLILTQPTMLFVNKKDIGVMREHEVDATQVGRPDLICLEYYNSAEDVDYLLKFNGISDPFSINEGDIIKIPVLGDSNYKKLERPSDVDENVVRQEFLDKKRLTPKDKKRIDFLKKKYGVKEVLPPNVLKKGFKTFKFTKDENGERTVMGMDAMTPDSKFIKTKKKSKEAKVESKKVYDTLDQDVKDLFNKNSKDLTITEVNILTSKGIDIEKFEDIKESINQGGENKRSSETKKVYDDNGNFVGTESTVKSEVYQFNKKTTTITKTIIKPDGSSETTQTTQTSAAGDNSNTIQMFDTSTSTYVPNESKDSNLDEDSARDVSINRGDD
tara:strand:+ start:1141 stop:2166 length:1026 start_codon:yes stop_codon:yes gene_type:complete